jgi:hypothetical protein
MSAITTRNGNNYNYSTAADFLDVNGDLIRRTGITGDSVDLISVTAVDMMTGFLNSTSSSYDGNSFTVTIQNTSTLYTILMKITFDTTSLVGGTSGYVTANNLSVTGGTGTGMKVNISASGGIVTSVTITNPGTGYLNADSITIQQGGSSDDATFVLVEGGFSMVPTNFYLIPPEGSTTFTFIKDSSSNMVIMVKDSGTLYSPVGPVIDRAIVIFDGTSGNMSTESGILIDVSDNITEVNSISINGSTSGTITLSASAIAGSTSFVFPSDNGTNGYILSTNGSGVTSWVPVSSLSPANFYGFGPATTPVTVSGTFTTLVVVTDYLSGSFVNTSGVLTIPASGVYELSYTAQFQTSDKTGGPESSFGSRIFLTGSLAGVANGSITECFMYEFNGDLLRASCTKTILLNLASSDTVELQVARTTGTSTAKARVDQCSLVIRRIE